MTKSIYAKEVPVLDGADSDSVGSLWAYAKRPGEVSKAPEGTIALLALRDQRGAPSGYKEIDAYLDRAAVRDLIDTLQGILDDAGPEPFDVSKVQVGDMIDATDAESLPEGSRVLCLINGYCYEVRDGGLYSVPPEGRGVRMIATAGGDVEVKRIGPAPIIEPEDIDYVLTRTGRPCYRKSNGQYNFTGFARPDGSEYEGYLTFEQIVRGDGPVTPVRIEKRVEERIVLEEVEVAVELDKVSA